MSTYKNLPEILEKLGIEQLNPMQEAASSAIEENSEIVLISPTGSGKTLAFLLPILEHLQTDIIGVQVLIVVPTRELAIQIDQVVRSMGSGWKTSAMYGGQSGSKDKLELKNPPTILIGTPGRIADHIRRGHLTTEHLHTLVLDEYDKSLEVGFEKEMAEIVGALPNLKRKVMTSATKQEQIPRFVRMENPTEIIFENKEDGRLHILVIPTSDKLNSLIELLYYLGDKRGILFCNFKDSIQQLQVALNNNHLPHVSFHGDMEQKDREKALLQFRNDSHRLLVATDLAARGIDVPELDFIIHYELPVKNNEFLHRNGRTARMHASGSAFVLLHTKAQPPAYLSLVENFSIPEVSSPPPPNSFATLYISAGRKDKISKGDIAGFMYTKGQLKQEELGRIEIQSEGSFVAVKREKAETLLLLLNGQKVKGRKVKMGMLG